MRTYRLMTAILASLLAASGAHAQQNYPTKPIRLIVPFPAGGQTDIVVRTLAHSPPDQLRDRLQHDVAMWQKVVRTANIKLGG